MENLIKKSALVLPIGTLLALGIIFFASISFALMHVLFFCLLIASVLISVYHAENIAHYLGHTLGALVLALSVTILEVGLILVFMLSDVSNSESFVRDTIFSAIMIVCNGVVGLAIVVGGLKYQKQYFKVQGTNSILVILVALSFFTLVLPSYTISEPGPYYDNTQLTFAAISSVVIYVVFVLTQTVMHKKDFEAKRHKAPRDATHHLIERKDAILSFWGLLISLVAVIALAKFLAPSIESTLSDMGAPKQFAGIVMALIILLPETLAAVKAAADNKLQVTLNLALGSGAASIALTIPCVAFFSIMSDIPLELGLSSKDLIFLVLTFLISSFSLGTGRVTILQGIIHVFVLLFYIVLTVKP